MSKCILLVISLFFSSVIFAQIKFSGTINDKEGNPLELANVIAVNQTTKVIESYNITDSKGKFSLNLKENTSYRINISYIGMENIQLEVATLDKDIQQNFILEQEKESLDEISLTYKIPLKIKGDTLIYDADSFKNMSDKKLEDVLKRLPGVEVDKDGVIKVEGIVVSQIKVEGKRFFDGSTKLATKNIPASVLDKIEVLKNHDDISQLNSVRDNSQNIAINIRLKENKKNFWFGNLTTGIGINESYLVNPNLFYYSPKKSVNVISNFNNIGDAPLSQSDLNRFSVQNNRIKDNGTDFKIRRLKNASLTLPNNKANSISSKFIAANVNYTIGSNWDLTGFAIFSGSRTNALENSDRFFTEIEEFVNPIENESTLSSSHFKSDMGIFKLSSSFKPNSNNQLDYNILGRVINDNSSKDFFSSVLQGIDERESQNSYNVTQDLNYYKTFDEKNIIAFESQYLLQNEDPLYNAIIAETSLYNFTNDLGLDQNQIFLNINQKRKVETSKFNSTLNYWHVITRNSNINLKLGMLFSRQNFNSEIFQLLDNGNVFRPNSAIDRVKNSITYNFNDLYLGLNYSLRTGAFTFSPGLSIHSYRSKNIQFEGATKKVFVRLLPDFSTIVKLKSTESIRLDYKIQTGFTEIEKLAQGIVLNNYNTLFTGNKDLSSNLSHNLSLYYSNSINMLNRNKRTLLSALVSYNKTFDAIRNVIDPQGVLQISTSTNSNFADENLNASLNLIKAFWKLELLTSGSLFYYKYNHIFSDVITTNESYSKSYKFGLRTNFIKEKLPNIEFGYQIRNNHYNQGVSSSKFITNSPFVNLDFSFFDELTVKADYSFYNYKNNTESLSKYSLFNANLAYQKVDSQWEYWLSATNILNTKVINQSDTNSFFISNTNYYIQPRYVVLGIKYNL